MNIWKRLKQAGKPLSSLTDKNTTTNLEINEFEENQYFANAPVEDRQVKDG